MGRCLVTKVPRCTHTSVPLSEAAFGPGASSRPQQKPATHPIPRLIVDLPFMLESLYQDLLCLSSSACPMPSLYSRQCSHQVL